jgi:hypothetical protein
MCTLNDHETHGPRQQQGSCFPPFTPARDEGRANWSADIWARCFFYNKPDRSRPEAQGRKGSSISCASLHIRYAGCTHDLMLPSSSMRVRCYVEAVALAAWLPGCQVSARKWLAGKVNGPWMSARSGECGVARLLNGLGRPSSATLVMGGWRLRRACSELSSKG